MEMQNAKAAAKADEKIQKAKLCHLQELLSIVKKERDEAREECRKLQERLSRRQSASSADSPCSFMHCSSMVSSHSCSPWSLNKLEEHLNNGNFGDFPKTPAPMELQQTLQSFSQSCNESLQALFSIEPKDSEEQFSLEILEQDLSFNADSSLNLGELEQDEEGLAMCEHMQSIRSLSRQSSSNSCSASVGLFQQMQTSRDLTEVSVPTLSPAMVIGMDVVGETPMSAMINYTSLPVTLSNDNNAIVVMGNSPSKSPPPSQLKPSLRAPACAEGSSCIKPISSNLQVFAGSPITSPMGEQQNNSNRGRQVHIPEPCEADPQVMLSSLPEKGKLLQAVMQAGPLLETLLLAGPLPQWRHPPPALNTEDIPKVSMVPSNVILPYSSHMPGPLMQGNLTYHTPINNGAFSPAKRVCVANLDPCSRTKLRKLSPALPHQKQFMHMSGEGMMAVGVSYPPAIY